MVSLSALLHFSRLALSQRGTNGLCSCAIRAKATAENLPRARSLAAPPRLAARSMPHAYFAFAIAPPRNRGTKRSPIRLHPFCSRVPVMMIRSVNQLHLFGHSGAGAPRRRGTVIRSPS